MGEYDVIEDFIIQLVDTGIFNVKLPSDITKMSGEEKHNFVSGLIDELARLNEKVLVIDEGSIVLRDRTFAPWFAKLCNTNIVNRGVTCFGIATRWRPKGKINFLC